MAKLTIDGLNEFVGTVVDGAKQGKNTYTPSYEAFTGLVEKIGDVFTLDGSYIDKLGSMNGEEYNEAEIAEEFKMNMIMPTVQGDFATEGAKNLEPAFASFEECCYNYPLAKLKWKTTEPYGTIKRAFNSTEGTQKVVSRIYQNLQNSYAYTLYAMKKQIIGNVCTKVDAQLSQKAGLATTVAIPVDAETGEKFIQAVHTAVKDGSFVNEGNTLATKKVQGVDTPTDVTILPTPKFTLYIKKGILDIINTSVLAGAFNPEKFNLGENVEVIELEDFGDYDGKTFCVLADSRMMSLHPCYEATRTADNADGDYCNIIRFYRGTAVISKYAYVHCFKAE